MIKEKNKSEEDPVNSPGHYNKGGMEVIECIWNMLSEEEYDGYCKGNVIKYVARAAHKDNADQDLKKARWYLNRLIDE